MMKDVNDQIKGDQQTLKNFYVVKSMQNDNSLTYSREKLKLNFKGRASIGSYNSHEEEMEENNIAAREQYKGIQLHRFQHLMPR